jgi:hypothetical protein
MPFYPISLAGGETSLHFLRKPNLEPALILGMCGKPLWLTRTADSLSIVGLTRLGSLVRCCRFRLVGVVVGPALLLSKLSHCLRPLTNLKKSTVKQGPELKIKK